MPRLSDDLSQYLEHAQRLRDQIADYAEQICLVPAPPFKEGERASFVADLFRDLGYEPVIDEIGNVVVRRSGAGREKSMMLLGHTDTVFPEGTDITVKRSNGAMTGPGIGDNSLGAAALLGIARALDDMSLQTAGDLILVANVGEEGLGNLRGARAAVDQFESELGAVIAVEGHSLGRVTSGAVGSRRIKVTVTGPGGHSWGAFGQPSAIHVLGHIIHEIDSLSVSTDPKTTYNLGMIEGGVYVNTIDPRATAVIDMRSVDVDSLNELASSVERIIAAQDKDQISTEVEVLGERPAGQTPDSSPIVQTGLAILRELEMEPYTDASSTDANVPISRGIPAVCVGVTRGEGAHRIEESIQIEPISSGIAQLLKLVMSYPYDK
jgi:acetylornithine deacetylase/succinyl-diaminopimelate desuccinylase-like protein